MMYDIKNDFVYKEMKRQEEQLIEMIQQEDFNLEKAFWRLTRLHTQKEKVREFEARMNEVFRLIEEKCMEQMEKQ